MDTEDETFELTSQQERLERRSERINIRLPIEVKGVAEDGRPFREKTHTVTINRHGARIVLHREPRPESRLTILNLQNNVASPFRVLKRVGRPTGGEAEWGVECLEPDINFWGIFFPLKKETPPPAEELVHMLLECTRCHFRELARLTPEEFETVTACSVLARPCSKCQTRTDWIFGFVEPDLAQQDSYAAKTSVHAAPAWRINTRRFKRVPVKLPVRIRMENIGVTENLSRGGICFSSTLPLKVGDAIMIALAYQPARDSRERPGRIVWRATIEGSPHALYGVEFED